MKNAFGMPLVVCIEDFTDDVKYYNYHRIQEYKKGTTYSWSKNVTFFNQIKEDKMGMYDEKGFKGLSTIDKNIFDKHFVDLDQSIIEVNNIFEEIMNG